jgi:hypothetical protein
MTNQVSSPKSINHSKSKIILELFVVCLIIAVAILDELENLSLNEDSTTYIEVASRILTTGRMTFLVRNTDFIQKPSLARYGSQAPGFPFILVPFLAVFHEPDVAGIIVQSLTIALFYFTIYWMTSRLKFKPLLKLVTLLLFTFLVPFLMIHRRIETETLFITLSIASAVAALNLLIGSNRKRDWILFGALVALSSMVRYTGLANLALVAPLLLRMDTLKAAWRLISHRFTLFGLLAVGGIMIGSAFLIGRLFGMTPRIGIMQTKIIIVGAVCFIAGSIGLILKGVSWYLKRSSKNLASQPVPEERQAPLLPLLVVIVSVVPTLIWFARNTLMFGDVSPANGLLASFHRDNLWVPFLYIWNDLFNVNSLLRPILLGLAMILLVLPFFLPSSHNGSRFRKTAHIALLSGAVCHFALLWFLSLVTNISPVRDRLFSPILAFLVLGIIDGIQCAVETPRLRKWGYAFTVVPLIFLFLTSTFSPSYFFQSIGKVNYPVEKQLWGEINRIDWTHTSSYFYSDRAYLAGGYIHQLYSGRPQGVIWNPEVLNDPGIVNHMLTGGVNPFILVTEHGADALMLDNMNASGNLPLEKISFSDTGFALYYLKK